MQTCAIVPVKPFNRAKSRLANALSPGQRELLAAGMMERTLRVLLSADEIARVLVISRDTKALALARDLGAHTIQESGAPELNTALARATQVLQGWDTVGALIVPADIPLLQVADLTEILNLGRYHHTVVIAPDRAQQGTNMLFVRPPGLIPYWFGEDSFCEHRRLALEAGAVVKIYQSERVGLDIDRPEDLSLYLELAQAWQTPIIESIGSAEWLVAKDAQPSS